MWLLMGAVLPLLFAFLAFALWDRGILSMAIRIFLAYWVLGLVVVAVPCVIKVTRELRAGYTTLANAYQQFEQRDPVTGETIRRAGDPLLIPKRGRGTQRLS
jgi:hypothetical protein